jgi:hypothetical protein
MNGKEIEGKTWKCKGKAGKGNIRIVKARHEWKGK